MHVSNEAKEPLLASVIRIIVGATGIFRENSEVFVFLSYTFSTFEVMAEQLILLLNVSHFYLRPFVQDWK